METTIPPPPALRAVLDAALAQVNRIAGLLLALGLALLVTAFTLAEQGMAHTAEFCLTFGMVFSGMGAALLLSRAYLREATKEARA